MAEKLKVTNSKQFERLVHLMQNHPDIARGTRTFGSSKQLVEEKWDSFAAELNSFGPPHRTGKEWQRVWINYKAKTKKKLSVNSANLRATGGGPSQELTLSALEQSVSELLHTQEVVNPSGSHFGTVQVLELQPSGSVAQNVNVDSVATSPSHTVTPSVRAANKKKR